MFFGKIIVKRNYDKQGDLVFRPLFRAYEKYGLDSLLKDNEASILGVIKDGVFYELFTLNPIPFSDYELVGMNEFNELLSKLPIDKMRKLKSIFNSIVFNNSTELNEEVSSIDELAHDRAIEYDAYDKELSEINPYDEPFGAYNDFSYKCQILEKRKTA